MQEQNRQKTKGDSPHYRQRNGSEPAAGEATLNSLSEKRSLRTRQWTNDISPRRDAEHTPQSDPDGTKNNSGAERCASGAGLIGRAMCRGGRVGVARAAIGRGACRGRPGVKSGDFRVGGQSGGEEKSAWVVFLGGRCGVWGLDTSASC